MSFSVRLAGRREHRKALKKAKAFGPFVAEDSVEILGERVRATSISLMQDAPKTGRVYFRDTGPHRASAPGEAPAGESGRLVASMQVTLVSLNQYAFASIVGTELPYGEELEFYGPNYDGNPRPFLRPAVHIVEQEVGAVLSDSWSKFKL